MSVVLKSPNELPAFVDEFLKKFPQGAVIGLKGDLGAGKTTFVRQVIQTLSERAGETTPRVPSPTFVFHQNYATQPPVEHFDLYRFDEAANESLVEIGYFEALERVEREGGYLFVEWPERAQKKALKCNAEIVITIQGESRGFDLN